MRLAVDGKSLLIGTFAGAALVASLGALQKGEPAAGRYQVAAAGMTGETTAYVVDTATGEVWRENPSTLKHAVEFLKPKLGPAE